LKAKFRLVPDCGKKITLEDQVKFSFNILYQKVQLQQNRTKKSKFNKTGPKSSNSTKQDQKETPKENRLFKAKSSPLQTPVDSRFL
jgi:hypothetical protein